MSQRKKLTYAAHPPSFPDTEHYSLWLCRKGGATLVSPSETVIVPEGSLCVLPPDGASRLVAATEETKWFGVLFSPDVLPGSFCLLPQTFQPSVYVDLTPEVRLACRSLESAAASGAKGDMLVPLALSEILLRLSDGARSASDDDKTLPERVMRYIDEHLSMPLSLDELAHRFFVSKFYLCRRFKAETGDSLLGYRTRRRVDAALRLIEAGETASAAAYHVGFGDYSTFFRACKKVYGRAPTATAEKDQR